MHACALDILVVQDAPKLTSGVSYVGPIVRLRRLVAFLVVEVSDSESLVRVFQLSPANRTQLYPCVSFFSFRYFRLSSFSYGLQGTAAPPF